ncbi:mariner Mos1 transposase [Trichonephila clavipes]|nr:mariner Mos1 transposase [Trichonephila clavipes]
MLNIPHGVAIVATPEDTRLNSYIVNNSIDVFVPPTPTRQQVWEDHLTSLDTEDGSLWGTAKAFRRKATSISALNGPTEQLNVDQSTVSSRLKAMGKIIKVGRWVPHEVTDRQQENQKIVCEMLLARYKRKSYLHRIVTGDEKWIYFENSKCNRSYVDPGQSSKSTARPKRFGRKTMLCIFRDQDGPIYTAGQLLRTDNTIIHINHKMKGSKMWKIRISAGY